MIIEHSPLKQKNIWVIDSVFQFIKKDRLTKAEKTRILEDTLFDIDFEVRKPNKKDSFTITLRISSLPENTDFALLIQLVGLFELKDLDNLTEDNRGQYILYSALPMLINSARTHIQQVTTFSPIGRYTIPALNLVDLISKWQEWQEKNKEE